MTQIGNPVVIRGIDTERDSSRDNSARVIRARPTARATRARFIDDVVTLQRGLAIRRAKDQQMETKVTITLTARLQDFVLLFLAITGLI